MHIETKSAPRPAGRHTARKRRTPGERLLEALQELANGKAQLSRHKERNWASITFAGTRHSIILAFKGSEAVEAGEDFIACLPEHEFAIPGQLVADAAILEVDHQLAPPFMQVKCEILMLEEG